MSDTRHTPKFLDYASHPHHGEIWKGSLAMCAGGVIGMFAAWCVGWAVFWFLAVRDTPESSGTPFDRLIKFGWMILVAIGAAVGAYMMFAYSRRCFKNDKH